MFDYYFLAKKEKRRRNKQVEEMKAEYKDSSMASPPRFRSYSYRPQIDTGKACTNMLPRPAASLLRDCPNFLYIESIFFLKNMLSSILKLADLDSIF